MIDLKLIEFAASSNLNCVQYCILECLAKFEQTKDVNELHNLIEYAKAGIKIYYELGTFSTHVDFQKTYSFCAANSFSKSSTHILVSTIMDDYANAMRYAQIKIKSLEK